MNVWLHEIRVRPVLVEIPDTCPGCKELIGETDDLDGYELSNRSLTDGQVLAAAHAIEWGDGRNEYEPAYTHHVAHRCGYVIFDGWEMRS